LLVNRGNVAALIEPLVEERRLPLASWERWREQIVGFIRDRRHRAHPIFPTMQRQCVSTLAAARDLALLQSVERFLVLEDVLLNRTLTNAASDIEPNARFTLDVAARALKDRDGTVDGFQGLLAITSRDGVARLIELLRNDPVFV